MTKTQVKTIVKLFKLKKCWPREDYYTKDLNGRNISLYHFISKPKHWILRLDDSHYRIDEPIELIEIIMRHTESNTQKSERLAISNRLYELYRSYN